MELLVAITVMSLMALMSWKGVDGMLTAQSQTQARNEQWTVLQTALGQWGTDLDHMVVIPNTIPIEWDGLVLRMTRLATAQPDAGARVVAWTRREVQGTPHWLRWQSPPVRTRGEWSQAWQLAAQWSRNPGEAERRAEVTLLPLLDWQIYYYRGGAWTNPQSSAADTGQDAGTAVPQGIRIELNLPPGPGAAGKLTRDWISPTHTGSSAP